MLDRRHFLGTVGTGLIGASGFLHTSLARAAEPSGPVAPRKKLAIVTTEWRYHSHAWHMGERFLRRLSAQRSSGIDPRSKSCRPTSISFPRTT